MQTKVALPLLICLKSGGDCCSWQALGAPVERMEISLMQRRRIIFRFTLRVALMVVTMLLLFFCCAASAQDEIVLLAPAKAGKEIQLVGQMREAFKNSDVKVIRVDGLLAALEERAGEICPSTCVAVARPEKPCLMLIDPEGAVKRRETPFVKDSEVRDPAIMNETTARDLALIAVSLRHEFTVADSGLLPSPAAESLAPGKLGGTMEGETPVDSYTKEPADSYVEEKETKEKKEKDKDHLVDQPATASALARPSSPAEQAVEKSRVEIAGEDSKTERSKAFVEAGAGLYFNPGWEIFSAEVSADGGYFFAPWAGLAGSFWVRFPGHETLLSRNVDMGQLMGFVLQYRAQFEVASSLLLEAGAGAGGQRLYVKRRGIDDAKEHIRYDFVIQALARGAVRLADGLYLSVVVKPDMATTLGSATLGEKRAEFGPVNISARLGVAYHF